MPDKYLLLFLFFIKWRRELPLNVSYGKMKYFGCAMKHKVTLSRSQHNSSCDTPDNSKAKSVNISGIPNRQHWYHTSHCQRKRILLQTIAHKRQNPNICLCVCACFHRKHAPHGIGSGQTSNLKEKKTLSFTSLHFFKIINKYIKPHFIS